MNMLSRGVLYLSFLYLFGCVQATFLVGPRLTDGSNVEKDAVTLIVTKEVSKHGVCGYVHQSIITKGPPFNDKPEIWTDQIGCGMKFGR